MNRKNLSKVVVLVWLVSALALCLRGRASSAENRGEAAPQGTPAPPAAAAREKPAELVFKNIQVMAGTPESQLLPTMHLMRAALGVRCDHCHVAENGKYWMDDKPAKQTARRMIQMVFDINKANFNGAPVVTCNTCHRGQLKPVGVPPVGQAAFPNTTRAEPGEPPPAPLPSAEEILNRYAQAVGGEAAGRVTTRVMKAVLIRPKLVNPSGAPWAVEVYQKAPDKLLTVVKSPDGVTRQGFNGRVGWVQTARGRREMSAAELAQVRRQADFHKELELKRQYASLKVAGREKVGEREAYLLEGVTPEGATEQLFFDAQTGLLLRRITFNKTVLGLDPVQTDFSDYRAVDGVQLPFTVQVSYIDNNHYGSTRRFTEIKQNVPVDDSQFDPPAASN